MHRDGRGNPSRSRPFSVIAALLALAIQLFVVQTHIHSEPAPASLAATQTANPGDIALDAASAPEQPGQLPAKDNSSDCPLCQAFAHSGTLLHPAALPGWAPAFSVDRAFHAGVAIQPDFHLSHSWFGRAPPVSFVPA